MFICMITLTITNVDRLVSVLLWPLRLSIRWMLLFGFGYDRACLLLAEYEYEYDVEVVWRMGYLGWTMRRARLGRTGIDCWPGWSWPVRTCSLISIYPDPDDVDLLDGAIYVISDAMYVTGISPGLLYKGSHLLNKGSWSSILSWDLV